MADVDVPRLALHRHLDSTTCAPSGPRCHPPPPATRRIKDATTTTSHQRRIVPDAERLSEPPSGCSALVEKRGDVCLERRVVSVRIRGPTGALPGVRQVSAVVDEQCHPSGTVEAEAINAISHSLTLSSVPSTHDTTMASKCRSRSLALATRSTNRSGFTVTSACGRRRSAGDAPHGMGGTDRRATIRSVLLYRGFGETSACTERAEDVALVDTADVPLVRIRPHDIGPRLGHSEYRGGSSTHPCFVNERVAKVPQQYLYRHDDRPFRQSLPLGSRPASRAE